MEGIFSLTYLIDLGMLFILWKMSYLSGPNIYPITENKKNKS